MSRKASAERRKLILLETIRTLSRVEVCHATNATLARASGLSESQVRRTLDALEPKEDFEKTGPQTLVSRLFPSDGPKIKRVLSSPFRERGEFRQRRKIYLVSESTDAHGALMLATYCSKMARHGRFHIDKLCGPLQCTRKQLERWLKFAVSAGYIGVTEVAPEVFLIERVGYFEPVKLPRRHETQVRSESDRIIASQSTWTPPPPEATVADRIRVHLAKSMEGKHGTCITDKQLAEAVQAPKRTVARHLSDLIKAGEYYSHQFAPGCGRGRILATRPLSAEQIESATPIDQRVRRDRAAKKAAPKPAKPKYSIRAVRARIEELRLRKQPPPPPCCPSAETIKAEVKKHLQAAEGTELGTVDLVDRVAKELFNAHAAEWEREYYEPILRVMDAIWEAIKPHWSSIAGFDRLSAHSRVAAFFSDDELYAAAKAHSTVESAAHAVLRERLGDEWYHPSVGAKTLGIELPREPQPAPERPPVLEHGATLLDDATLKLDLKLVDHFANVHEPVE